MGRFRSELLKIAWRDRGTTGFLQQAASMVLASGPLLRVFGFVRNCDQAFSLDNLGTNSLELSNFTSWQSIPPSIREALSQVEKRSIIRFQTHLDQGWRLYVAIKLNRLAAFGWSRMPDDHWRYVIPLKSGSAHGWYTETLPDFRGQGIFPLIQDYKVRTLATEGIVDFYTTCATYNRSSRKGIEKAGFRCIGWGLIRAGSGEGIAWFPYRKSSSPNSTSP